MKLKLTEELWKVERREYVRNLLPRARYRLLWGNGGSGQEEFGGSHSHQSGRGQRIGSLEELLAEAGFDEKQGIFSIRKELVGFTPIEVAL